MPQKEYKELELTDNFMFCKVLTNHVELCRRFVELILGVPISKIVIREYEKSVENTPMSKGIRMDVYLNDERGTVYDLEMQNSKQKSLPKRMRYYQGTIDVHTLERGKDYSKLPRSIIVFICSFDLYDKGLPVYDFENRCKQNTDLLLGDETRKVIVNLNGNTEHLDYDLKALYNYLKNHEVQDDFTRELDEAVRTAKERYEWGTEYNMWRANEMQHQIELEEAREEGEKLGVAKGRKEGLERGREEGIESTINLLMKLKNGESEEKLLAEGVPQEVIDQLMKLI